MILNLNNPQNDFKLTEINNGFVVTIEDYVPEDGYFLMGDDIMRNSNILTHEWCKSKQPKIIFITRNLYLENVPPIEDEKSLFTFEQINDAWDSGFNSYKTSLMYGSSEIYKSEYFKYIKPQEEKLFTQDEVEHAMAEIVDYCLNNIGNPNPQTGKKVDEIINSIKLPKVFITFENNLPIKCEFI